MTKEETTKIHPIKSVEIDTDTRLAFLCPKCKEEHHLPLSEDNGKAQSVLSQILLGLDEYVSFNSVLPFGVDSTKMSYVFAAQCAELIRSQEAELTRIKNTEQKLRQCVEYYASRGISLYVNGSRKEISNYAKDVLKELYHSEDAQ